jgi:UDP:flavonoid glycosyltransferase YjiC (YdhE family)
VTVIAATAGRVDEKDPPSNARVADYLPGQEAVAQAKLVICNGGSPATQQALAAGVPVLGLCSNMDQFLNMEAICRTGAGLLLRAGHLDGARLRMAVNHLLAQPEYTAKAKKLAKTFSQYDAIARFQALVGAGAFDRVAS